MYHPDKEGNQAEFIKIQYAYEFLSDPDKRKDYGASRPDKMATTPAPSAPKKSFADVD